MNFDYSDKAKQVRDAVSLFMSDNVYPNEQEILAQLNNGNRWQSIEIIESLISSQGEE